MLTTTQKDKKIKLIIHRDGNVCFYDARPFMVNVNGEQRTIDHLNNNEKDNRVENLVLCHFNCNQRKKTDIDMQILAKEKLTKNVNSTTESLRVSERDNHAHTDRLTEGELNKLINKVVFQILDEQLPTSKTKPISYTRTLKSITYLVIQESGGRGSEVAVRRALDAHCSDFAPWQTETEGRSRSIWRRKLI